jgi:predicted nucleic acid-binding protein
VDRALLDSDVIIWYLRGREHARRWLDQLKKGGVPCCSALSVTEIVIGMRPREVSATREFLEALDVVPVERPVAWRAGELIREYARRGVTLDFVDATIAATCLAHQLVLATYNIGHYPMTGLRKAPAPS